VQKTLGNLAFGYKRKNMWWRESPLQFNLHREISFTSKIRRDILFPIPLSPPSLSPPSLSKVKEAGDGSSMHLNILFGYHLSGVVLVKHSLTNDLRALSPAFNHRRLSFCGHRGAGLLPGWRGD
jgi:hypothetical protein